MNLEWRLLNLEKQNGLFNTALDSFFVRSVASGNSLPSFILTEWKPTVSIGCSQSFSLDVNKEECKKYGIDIVRRESGGQAVYLDENYIVFAAIAPRSFFSLDLTELRKEFCELGISVLINLGLNVEFYQPDNIVIKENGFYKTIGNSGQIIKRDTVAIKSTIRYKLNDLDRMVEVLKVNGRELLNYKDEIKSVLGDVVSYNSNFSKKKIKSMIIKEFSDRFGVRFFEDKLSYEENSSVIDLMKEFKRNLYDKPHFTSRGVCYLYLNGRPIVKALNSILPYNEPSRVVRSDFIEVKT